MNTINCRNAENVAQKLKMYFKNFDKIFKSCENLVKNVYKFVKLS